MDGHPSRVHTSRGTGTYPHYSASASYLPFFPPRPVSPYPGSGIFSFCVVAGRLSASFSGMNCPVPESRAPRRACRSFAIRLLLSVQWNSYPTVTIRETGDSHVLSSFLYRLTPLLLATPRPRNHPESGIPRPQTTVPPFNPGCSSKGIMAPFSGVAKEEVISGGGFL